MNFSKHKASLVRFPVTLLAAALLTAGTGNVAAVAASGPDQAVIEAVQHGAAQDVELHRFYHQRGYRPLWVEGTSIGLEAEALLRLLGSAEADGLDSADYLRPAVLNALRRAAKGTPKVLARAELELSRVFADFVRDSRTMDDIGIVYGEPALRPSPPRTGDILGAAAVAPSLQSYIGSMGWMHPIYAGLRRAIADASAGSAPEEMLDLLKLNLERARVLPAHGGPYIVVDAAAAQLTYYENGDAQESMRVVVGTPGDATPMMVGMLRYATLNPYWHVPPDLTRERIAPRVLTEGLSYFRNRGYEVVDEWTPSGKVIDPKTIDWKAVAQGRTEIFVRQKPGPRNGMGKVKFQFPNDLGIYLHDTPAKQLFELDDRSASAGCVRLEDADALARMLFGEQPVPTSDEPEQTLHLPRPVPVYITYLTAVPKDGRIVQRKDIYGWDKPQLSAAAGVGRPGPALQ